MLDELLARQAGVIARWQALPDLTDAAIKQRVRAGLWRRVHRGVFVDTLRPPTREQRWWVASLAAGVDAPALLGGLTALEVLGMRGHRRETVDVLLPSSRRADRPPHGVWVHRTNQLPESDTATGLPPNLPPCTAAVRSMVDAASWSAGEANAREVIVAAIRQRLVDPAAVPPMLARLAPVRRSRLIAITAADVEDGARTLAEIEFLAGARQAGLPRPELRRVRAGSGGRRTVLDVRYEPYGVRVVVDGAEPPETLVDRTLAALLATGWRR